MGSRRIIIDSDDDSDDFTSLCRKPTGTSVKLAVKKTTTTASSHNSAVPPTTVARRRRLGNTTNDNSLFLPWNNDNERSRKSRLRLVRDSSSVSSSQKATQLDTILRPRKAKDRSNLSIGSSAPRQDTELGALRGVINSEKSEDELESDDGDSSASSFCDASPASDASLDSLGDFFRRSATPTRLRRKTTATQNTRAGSQKCKSKTTTSHNKNSPSNFSEDASSIFYSADEFLSTLDKPMGKLCLDSRKGDTGTANSDTSSVSGAAGNGSPQKKQIGSLASPKKKLPNIPQTPHRPSTDAFWNQQIIDEWNMHHSPRKLLFDTDKATKKTAAAVPMSASPSKMPAKQREAKRLFQQTRHQIAEAFLAELDSAITDGELARLTATTGGVKIQWSNKLNTTAGRANWKRETRQQKQTVGHGDISTESGTKTATTLSVHVAHHASIELAEKVINDEHKLLNVMAHEFCHLANFMVSGVTGNPHGKEFKAWAAKCSKHFGRRGIQVTTKHSYEIDFKYVWTCTECSVDFKRHSKSIDPTRHRCGACKGQLQQTKPAPRGSGRTGGPPAAPSDYQMFMKEQMAVLRRENPKSPQKDIMKLVADKWTRTKEEKRARSAIAASSTETEANCQPAVTRDVQEAAVDLITETLSKLPLD